MSDHAAHRSRLLAGLGPDEALLVFSAPTARRNGDSEYRYRPSSDLFWLTGWEEPDAAAFFRPGDTPWTHFAAPRDPDREVWEGPRGGPQGAKAMGAADAWPIEALPRELPRLLTGVRALHVALGEDAEHDAIVLSAVRRIAKLARTLGHASPETFHAPWKLLHELRLIKGADEVEALRRAAALTAVAHRAAMRATRPGAREYEVEAAIVAATLAGGGTGVGYTPIVAAGAHATTLHHISNRGLLADGDLLLVDAGSEVGWYTADVTRTWPIGRRFSQIQRDAYEVVLAAQQAAIAAVAPGSDFVAVHSAAERTLAEGLGELGLLKGPDRTADLKRYYMHFTGHWLGLDVHDAGLYARDGRPRRFEPGMVVTVEPGVYVQATDPDAPAAWRGLGIRIEDDVLVTETGCEVLTAAIPKSVDALHALRDEDLGA